MKMECAGEGAVEKLFKATTKDLPLQNDTPDRRRKISKESPLMNEASGIVIPNLFYPWSQNRKMPLRLLQMVAFPSILERPEGL